MQKILTVSVAAYNVEPFIQKCLDSFIQEEILDKLEVIVTDDGSSDRTPELVAEYQKKYPDTFRLIRQSNAGPGSTVNSGIRHAAGKYFRMVDGDDWVNTADMPSFIRYLEANDVDMVCTNFCSVDHTTGRQEPNRLKTDRWGQKLKFSLVCRDLKLEMHHVTYRTQILKEHDIRLDNCFYTDVEYLLFPAVYAETIAFLDLTVYMYRVALGTQSMNMSSLQKNEKIHRHVLMQLVSMYSAYQQSDYCNEAKSSYLRKRIAAMAGTQLSIYLSFADTAHYRRETILLLQELKAANREIYDSVAGIKTFRILISSGFCLFGPIAAIHKRRLKKG